MRTLAAWTLGALIAVVPTSARAGPAVSHPVRALDGRGNNLAQPDLGRANTPYRRVAAPAYADGIARMLEGPPARYVSNRIFSDVSQNLFSERDVSQWGFTWGQFLDHDFGLRDETPAERAPIAFDAADPLEQFSNELGVIDFARTPALAGTGVTSARQQLNTVSSYIDASGVYGLTRGRLDWLRKGRLDGIPANNRARLLATRDGYLPRRTIRGNTAAAPPMNLMGRLLASPTRAVVAGDVRANENIALTATHTLFVREHNRIVAALPASLSEEARFQIARRVVGAEIQYITYTEFLPALGVRLRDYRGYDPSVDPGLANEFAVVGYRAHSMIHGELEPVARAGRYSRAELAALRARGIEVDSEDGDVVLVIPLNLAFGNPDLLHEVGLGPLLAGLGRERQYRNDEQIDNQLRSVLFQVPAPGVSDPSECLEGEELPECFSGVVDLGAIDIARGRDHGMPSYNDLRRAYGLPPKGSFRAITGERTERVPRDREIDAPIAIDDPDVLDFVELRDRDGERIRPGSAEAEEDAVAGIRRTTVAARLKAIYGDVGKLDAFVGMVAERHVKGAEFGELQLAIWKEQFEAVRDGDRFFFRNDPYLRKIARQYGIDYRRTLADVIEANTGVTVADDVFKVEFESESPRNAKRLAVGPRRDPQASGELGAHRGRGVVAGAPGHGLQRSVGCLEEPMGEAEALALEPFARRHPDRRLEATGQRPRARS